MYALAAGSQHRNKLCEPLARWNKESMGRRWKEIPSLVRTPVGRSRLLSAIRGQFWPILLGLAIFYRRTFVRNTKIVAVVGSFGKSTTMRAVTVAFGQRIHRRAMSNAKNAVASAIFRIRPTDRRAVIEVGIDKPGKMAMYARLVRPNVTIVTSIGSEHNRSLKTLEVTRSEKAEMVRILAGSGLAVLNGDDPNVLWMQSQTRVRVITFGFAQSNDIRASDLTLDWPGGMCFKLHARGETRIFRTSLIGKHMVYPVLAAVAVALAEGFILDEIIPRLEALTPTPGRMQAVPLTSGAILLRDDFKSALETFDVALDALSEIPAQRRIVVFGEVSEPPGSQGPIYRRLGERVGHIVSRAIFVGDSGVWSSFAAGAKRGGLARAGLINAQNSVCKAVDAVREKLGPGDVVLVKGRDNQRLERVSLALMGRTVRCDIDFCKATVRCERCPMLERGWNGVKSVM
jgi:UDP-N-acetylmuramoyl-tripeptide--D-alanyl-D-alanine ligase